MPSIVIIFTKPYKEVGVSLNISYLVSSSVCNLNIKVLNLIPILILMYPINGS